MGGGGREGVIQREADTHTEGVREIKVDRHTFSKRRGEKGGKRRNTWRQKRSRRKER